MRAFLQRLWPSFVLTLPFLAIAGSASAQVQVSIKTLYPVETIYIADVTPNNASAHPDIFDITLINGSTGNQTVVLQLSVARIQPTRAEIFQGTTNPFVLNVPVRHITNRELFGHGDAGITDYSIATDAIADIRDQVLQTGRLPAGSYLFAADVRTPQGVALGHGELRIDIGNPTRVDLLSPGRRFGESPPTEQPTGLRFLWTSDGSAAGSQYRLRVVRVETATSDDEAMQGNASWETTTPATSEVYPASAVALRLEPRATYAWQVTREISSSSGVERVKSPVFWFRVGGPGSQTAGGGVDETVRLRVEELLKKLGLSSELNGFHPVSAMLADGRVLSFETLDALIAAIQSGQVPLASIKVK